MSTGVTQNRGDYPELPRVEAPGYDFGKLMAQWVEGDPYQPEPGTEECYHTKARIAAYLKPTRVVEIGVRAGYSAIAFHMGHPFTEFYGLDMDEGGWGGVKGYMQEAEARLMALPHLHSLSLERGDSQTRKTLPPEGWHADLFHVDGDHTPKGCAHDIILALTTGARFVVVDDYDYTEHVADGVDWAVKQFGLTAWYAGDGGYRGNVVIRGKR